MELGSTPHPGPLPDQGGEGVQTERPQLLCKFRPWRKVLERDRKTGECVERNRTKEMLAKAEFYCPPPRYFDDPHDGLQGARPTGSPRDIDGFLMHNMLGVAQMMQKQGIDSLTQLDPSKCSEQDQITLRRLMRKKSRRKTRVLSLSDDPANELMWSFYADNHRGICLCFDADHPFFADARPVVYSDDPMALADSSDIISANDPLLYCKGPAWKWQQEWRVVWAEEEPKIVPFPREALKAVVIGEWFQYAAEFEDLKKTLVEGGYRVQILQMERLPDSFAYQLVHIEDICGQDLKQMNETAPR